MTNENTKWKTGLATQFLASPQTSFAVRLSRIHFSPTWGEMNAWQTNPKGRLRGGYIIPEFFFLENLGNCREKIKKFENFRQFEHSPDILETFHGKNVDKMFFCCIPTDQERAQSYMLQQRLSTEHYKSAVFLSESSTLRLISGYSPKKALAIPFAIKKKFKKILNFFPWG